nr:hypothetical protein [Methylosinus sp. H3A]
MRPCLAVERLLAADRRIHETIGFLLGGEQLHVFVERSLIASVRDDVIGLLVLDLLGDGALTAHGVDGDDGAFYGHHVQERGNGDDLVGFFRYGDLPHDEPLPGGESRDDVDRLLRALLLIGAARGFAVGGDDLGWRLSQSRDPGDEAALERLRVERGENVAEMVVRQRAVFEWPEATQQVELFLAEPRDVGEGLRPGQHGEQAQEQDLVERIDDLPGLPAIRHIFEID